MQAQSGPVCRWPAMEPQAIVASESAGVCVHRHPRCRRSTSLRSEGAIDTRPGMALGLDAAFTESGPACPLVFDGEMGGDVEAAGQPAAARARESQRRFVHAGGKRIELGRRRRTCQVRVV